METSFRKEMDEDLLIWNWMCVWWMSDQTDVRNQIMFEIYADEWVREKGSLNVCLCLTAVDSIPFAPTQS